MKLSIIIPTYNEEKTIEILLKKVNSVKLPNQIKKEIILVDDGSTDKTKKVLSEFQISNFKFQILRHKRNQGKGAAVRSGLKVVSGDYVIIQDADLEYNPQDYINLLRPVINQKAKVVFGTRLLNYPLKFWGKNKTVMPLHLITNHLLTTLTNLLYSSNLTDMETCYKLIKRDVLEDIKLKSNKFDIEPEVTAKILKLKIPIIEVPIKVKPRTYREGKKIKWTDGIIAVWTLIKYKFLN